jgi:hypothetical protein
MVSGVSSGKKSFETFFERVASSLPDSIQKASQSIFNQEPVSPRSLRNEIVRESASSLPSTIALTPSKLVFVIKSDILFENCTPDERAQILRVSQNEIDVYSKAIKAARWKYLILKATENPKYHFVLLAAYGKGNINALEIGTAFEWFHVAKCSDHLNELRVEYSDIKGVSGNLNCTIYFKYEIYPSLALRQHALNEKYGKKANILTPIWDLSPRDQMRRLLKERNSPFALFNPEKSYDLHMETFAKCQLYDHDVQHAQIRSQYDEFTWNRLMIIAETLEMEAERYPLSQKPHDVKSDRYFLEPLIQQTEGKEEVKRWYIECVIGRIYDGVANHSNTSQNNGQDNFNAPHTYVFDHLSNLMIIENILNSVLNVIKYSTRPLNPYIQNPTTVLEIIAKL